MNIEDKPQFFKLIANVCAFYRQDFSEFAGSVWWQAMQPFDFAAVADALNRHCINPDSGQFMPKPADAVRVMRGTSKDGALLAWSLVDRHVRQTGIYASVKFVDRITQRVLYDMGGWIRACSCPSEEEWVFVGKEFENRFRGYAASGIVPECPDRLIGMAEAQNAQNGMPIAEPVVIGESRRERLGFVPRSSGSSTEVRGLL